MQQTKDIIIKAIALIENPDAWTQGAAARDSTGLSVSAIAPQACRWCTLGALDKVANDYNSWLATTRHIRDILREEKPYTSLSRFNDNHTHAEVLALLRKAAE